MTTVLDRVRAFVGRLAPEPVCDGCIADRLGLSVHQHADRKARELAGMGGFVRAKGRCGLCGEDKPVTGRQ